MPSFIPHPFSYGKTQLSSLRFHLPRSGMMSSLLTLPSTFSRLNLVPKALVAIPISLNLLKSQKQRRLIPWNYTLLTCPPLNSLTTHFSTFRSSVSPKTFHDDLVVLGIETSCDDTAAAVVSPLPCVSTFLLLYFLFLAYAYLGFVFENVYLKCNTYKRVHFR